MSGYDYTWEGEIQTLSLNQPKLLGHIYRKTDLETIQHERFHHPHPRVQQKMEVLWLKSQGLTHEEIGQFASVSRRTVQRVLDDFLAGGIGQVRKLSFRQPESELLKHKNTLEDYFLENPPASAAQAQAVIEKLTGVKRGLTQVRQFLKKVSTCAIAR